MSIHTSMCTMQITMNQTTRSLSTMSLLIQKKRHRTRQSQRTLTMILTLILTPITYRIPGTIEVLSEQP
jgi:predicted nucleic acid-binding Zn ribbon protein